MSTCAAPMDWPTVVLLVAVGVCVTVIVLAVVWATVQEAS